MIKREILKRSRHGLEIYQLVLREIYPGELIIQLNGYDVEPTKNPFNSNRKTLKLYKDGDRYMYHDTENMGFKGDPFEFAELHYKIAGIPLFKLLNKELKLQLNESHFNIQKGQDTKQPVIDFHPILSKEVTIPEFTFFKAPITKVYPYKNMKLDEAYNLIRSNAYLKNTQKLRSKKNPEDARNFKKYNFDYATFSGIFSSRKNEALSRHSGLITIDFDHLPDAEGLKEKLKNDPCLDTQLLFISPSGDGLKWIISANLGDLTHSEYFKAVGLYIKDKYNITIDGSGKDVSRACFLPHDPDVYINPNVLDGTLSTKKFDAKEWLKKDSRDAEIKSCPPQYTLPDTTQAVEHVIRLIEESHIDITTGYANWCNIGFALASEFKEQGRDYFHRISKFYSDYKYSKCDRQYTACMNSNPEKITIGTFFHWAKQAGIYIAHPKNEQNISVLQIVSPTVQHESEKEPAQDNHNMDQMNDQSQDKLNDQDMDQSEDQANGKTEIDMTQHPFHDTPRIPESVHSCLPVLLRECCDKFADAVEKDVVLIGAITVISGCLPNLEGKYFRKLYSPHIYSFVTAPAGSGKGILDWASYLGNPIHESLVRQSMIAKAEYERELAEYNSLGKNQRDEAELPLEPIRKKLFVPANCSASAFIQALAENDFRIMIFETEADTLASSLKQEWGNFCDVLRKAFHHEKTSMFRRKDHEFIEIHNPQLAIMLAGTPKQVQNMMPDVENGLFSRFLYYAFEHHTKFKNPFIESDDDDLASFFKKKGEKVKELYETLKRLPDPARFCLTPEQGELFTQKFEDLYERNRLLLNSDFNANSLRLGLITFRIAMVLTALRVLEDGEISSQLVCSDTDFETAIQIVFTLDKHSVAVYQNLPDNQMNGIKMTFYKALPEEFNRHEALTIANTFEIKERTMSKYLIEMKKAGLLTHKHNSYTKTSNNGNSITKGLNNDKADGNTQQAA